MISNFKYLEQIAEAYKRVNENITKDAKKLLDTKYSSVYKGDGYDQFGVDRNGKNREGKPVIWKYPDMGYVDIPTLEKLLAAAAKKERKHNGEIKHNYDRYGFDTLGFDKQGFDIADRDILGYSGTEFGTAEYDSMKDEREHARHNLHSKLTMREHNFEKSHPNITKQQEKYIIDAYGKAIKTANPKQSFKTALKTLFVKYDGKGHFYFDLPAINYYLNKFKFSDKEDFNMNNVEFLNQFVALFREQMNRMFRPESAELYFNFDIRKIDEENSLDEKFEIVARLKRDVVLNKTIKTLPLLNAAKIAANRIEKILPYNGYSCWSERGRDYVKIYLVIQSEFHSNKENRSNLNNIRDDFDKRFGIGVYGKN